MAYSSCTVLIVDDLVENIKVASQHLQSLHVKIIYATSGEQAIQRALNVLPDLILMDIMMPHMDGISTVLQMKENKELKNIPVIFLTAKADVEDLKRGFDAGGVDYITKPFEGEELLARVGTHLELSRYRKNLELEVQKRTKDIELLKASIIEAMGSLAEYRDNETGSHIQRTQHYVKLLCENLSKQDRYAKKITPEYINLLFKTAPLHDIGKVGIRDDILLKPGKLTAEEFEQMKKHAAFGEDIIGRIIEKNGDTDFLQYAKLIAGGHHEKWDGSGYPRGLKGEDIPLCARIMAVADVYDALTTKRVYKDAFSHEEACAMILEGKGKHFDPNIVDVLELIHEKFLDIAKEFQE